MTASQRTVRACAIVAIALCAAVLTALLLPASSDAKFKVGFQEFDYVTPDAGMREELFKKSAKENASVVRINLAWNAVARRRPADATNPADPAYDFSLIDAAVQAAAQRDLQPLLTIYRAPPFAEGPGRPTSAPVGTWRPSARALADFARAVATRYSGDFGGLPRVRDYQVWNEPNLNVYITPQREGDHLVSPSIFRGLVNAFYEAVKGVDPRNRVITAGTAPYGDDSGDGRIRPLAFLRAMFCLAPDLSPGACSEQTRFDALAHHPINTTGGPTQGATHPDDAAGADFKKVVKTLRAAERAGRAPGGRHQVWATEIWWETNPPDTFRGLPLQEQARYIEQAFYVLWKQGADVALNFQVHDGIYDPANPLGQFQTGVFFRDFKPKPSATAFKFPFVTDRRSKKKVLAWGIAPKKGKLRIQRKAGKRWRNVDKLRAKPGKVFTTKLRVKGKAKLRAKVRGKKSLVWTQKGAGGDQKGAGRRHEGAGHHRPLSTAPAAPPLFRPSAN